MQSVGKSVFQTIFGKGFCHIFNGKLAIELFFQRIFDIVRIDDNFCQRRPGTRDMLNQRIGFGIEERGRFGIARLNPHIFVNSAQFKHFGGNNIKGNINGRSAQNPAFLAGRILKNLFLIFGKFFLIFNTRRSFHMQPVRTINQMRSDNLNRTYDFGAFFGSLLLRNLNNQALAFAQRNFVKAGFFRVQKSFAAVVNVNEKPILS